MDIAKLIENQKHFHTLSQEFYNSEEVFDLDCKSIIYSDWLYVCHRSELDFVSNKWIVHNVGNESVILINSSDDIKAFHNVCRHRGSRLLHECEGRSKLITCPYHHWTYNSDGVFKRGKNVKKRRAAAHDLHPVHLTEYEGFLFVNFAKNPEPFNKIKEHTYKFLEPYNTNNIKLIHKKTWTVNANWKLVVENFRECYHCHGAHPEYTAINDHVSNQKDFLIQTHKDIPNFNEWQQKYVDINEKAGRPWGHVYRPNMKQPVRCFAQPINGVSQTMTKDGKLAAMLLGDFEESDGGELGIQFGSLNYLYGFNDYICMFRYTPKTVKETEIELHWFVNSKDDNYDKDNITWLWDVTTEQDVEIINGNQLGINSSAYQQSEYVSPDEDFTYQWVQWYLKTIKENLL